MTNSYKGIDDLLASGRKPTRLRGDAVTSFFASVRARLGGLLRPPSEQDPSDHPHPQRLPFPVDVYPASVAHFVRSLAAATGCPVDFPGLAVLVISGAAIGATRAVQLKADFIEMANLYGVIVGRPGTGKTPVLKAVMQPIYEMQDSLYRAHLLASKQHEEATREHKRALRTCKKDEPHPEPPVPPVPLRHLYAKDTTVESLAANLLNSPRGILVCRDELTAWVRAMNMYRAKGTDTEFYTAGWSREAIKIDRKYDQGTPLIISQPFI
jgi:hypothetical protein